MGDLRRRTKVRGEGPQLRTQLETFSARLEISNRPASAICATVAFVPAFDASQDALSRGLRPDKAVPLPASAARDARRSRTLIPASDLIAPGSFAGENPADSARFGSRTMERDHIRCDPCVLTSVPPRLPTRQPNGCERSVPDMRWVSLPCRQSGGSDTFLLRSRNQRGPSRNFPQRQMARGVPLRSRNQP
jgi:hypothetical protein